MKEFTKSSTLLNAEPSGDEKSLKLTFDIVMKEDKNLNDFISEVSSSKEVTEVSLTAAKNDIDY